MKPSYLFAQERLIRALLQSANGMKDFSAIPFDRKWLDKDHRKALEGIEKYTRRNGGTPSVQWVRKTYPDVPLRVKPKKSDSVKGIASEIREGALHAAFADYIEDLTDKESELREDPLKYTGVVEDLSVLVRAHTDYSNAVHTMATRREDLWEEWLARKEGRLVGTPIPFPFLRDTFQVWRPGDLVCVAAKTGVGKTWFLLWQAWCSALAGRKSLFVSYEMSVDDILMRLTAIATRLPYGGLQSFDLSRKKMRKFRRFLDASGPEAAISNIHVVSPGDAPDPDVVNAMANTIDAEDVYVDSFYLMDGPGDEHWKQVRHNSARMRFHSLDPHRRRMWMCSTQLNEDAKSVMTATTETLAYYKGIARDMTTIVALVQSERDKRSGRMAMKVMKARAARTGGAFEYFLDPKSLAFKEQGEYLMKSERKKKSAVL